MEKITVLVEVHGINSSSIDFDIPFPKGEDANIINLTKKLSRKNTTVKQCIDSGNYMYKVESSIIKGRWILIGEDSPLKHGTTVRCEINNNNNSTSAYHNETLEDSDAGDMLVPTPPKVRRVLTFNGQTVQLADIVQVEDLSSEDIAILPDGPPREASSIAADQFNVAPASQSAWEPSSHASQEAATQAEAQHAKQEVQKPIPKIYKPPTTFGYVLDKKLANSSLILTDNDQAAIVRETCNSIRVYGYNPSAKDLLFVTEKLVEKYPRLEDIAATRANSIEKIANKMRLRFNRLRVDLAKMDPSKKNGQGRPRKIVESHSPGLKVAGKPNDGFDMVSYNLNTAKIKEIFKAKQSKDSVAILLELTFPIRRQKIKSGELLTVKQATDECPYLNQLEYLQWEFDKMIGTGSWNRFRQLFLDAVPSIVSVAKQSDKETVKQLLKEERFAALDEDQDVRCRFVLEVLPRILLGKKRKRTGVKFVFDQRKEGANVRNAIIEEKRHGPFILAVGNQLTIIADQDPYMPIGNNTAEAITALMAVYYVFNFGYPDVVRPTLLFFQSFCMEKPDGETEKCSSLSTLIGAMKVVEAANNNTV